MSCGRIPPLRGCVNGAHATQCPPSQRQALSRAVHRPSKSHRRLQHPVSASASAAEEEHAQGSDAAAIAASSSSTASSRADTAQAPSDVGPTLRDEVSDPAQPQPYASEVTESTATRVDLRSSSVDGATADGNGQGAEDDLGMGLWAEAQQGQQMRDDYQQDRKLPAR